MNLALHQLTLRYERLRKRSPLEERALLVSLSEIGHQLGRPLLRLPVFAEMQASRLCGLKRELRRTIPLTY